MTQQKPTDAEAVEALENSLIAVFSERLVDNTDAPDVIKNLRAQGFDVVRVK